MGKVTLSCVSTLKGLKMLGLNIQTSVLTQATVTKRRRQGKDKQQERIVDSSEV